MMHRSSVPHACFLDICHLSHISKGKKPHTPPFPNLFPPLSPTHTQLPSLLSPSVVCHSSLLVHVSSAAGARYGEGTCSGRRRWWWHRWAGALSLCHFFLSISLSFLSTFFPAKDSAVCESVSVTWMQGKNGEV